MFWERQSPPAHSGWGPLLVELERSNKTVLWDRLVLLPFFPFQIHLNISQIIPKELEREFSVLYKRTIWMFHDMEDLSSNQANKCYQNLILPLIPLQYFHTKIGRTSSFKFSLFLMKYVEETSRTTGTGRGCQDIKTSLNTMLLRTGFVDSCQSFFFGFLDITSDIQLEQNTKLQ